MLPVTRPAAPPTGTGTGVLLLEPAWEASEAPAPLGHRFSERQILIGEGFSLGSQTAGVPVIELSPEMSAAAAQLMALLQEKINSGATHNALLQLVVPGNGDGQVAACLGGMLRSARGKCPRIVSQIVFATPSAGSAELAAHLVRESNDHPAGTVHHRHRGREVLRFVELAGRGSAPWRDEGVYLITGGAGGLGRLIAREIASTTSRAAIILLGRSAANAAIEQQIQFLNSAGSRAEYNPVDIADLDAVVALVDDVQSRFGRINGIVHSAGVLEDGVLAAKTPAQLRASLAPKIAGTINLDSATKNIGLEFFVCFSSLAGPLGNFGHAGYATGNAFLDAFAAHRNQMLDAGLRRGRTLSVNWPLWECGGMRGDKGIAEAMRARHGIGAFSTPDAFRALYAAIASGWSQVLVLAGDLPKL